MKKTILPLSLLAMMALGGAAIAGSGKTVITEPPVEEPCDWCDTIWSLPTLYKNDDNAFLQEFKLIGRYHGQYAWTDSDQGDRSDWENRRWRVGSEVKLFNFLKLFGQIDINEDIDPFYKGIDEAWAEIKLGKNNKLVVGKQKQKFTHEWTTSSKKIVTFERSLLVNQIIPDKSTGASYYGQAGDWKYSLGVATGDGNAEFGDFNEGVFGVATLGKDLGFADWTLGYLYNSSEGNNTTSAYGHAFSNSLIFGGDGPLTVATDLIYADGYDGDAYGAIIIPTYDLTEKLQLVGRYQYAHGDNDSLRAQSRYERRVPDITDGGRGEEYHAFYTGLNYYICDHKLKLMAGAEYADLQDKAGDGGDFEGWTLFTGVRMYF
ncbi:MAG: phosphate-selective porin OprO/OprP [Pseudoalteromonas tetraodonis]|jgi:phosphate-selective porin OprO/OprP